jgi:hypothetical protein
LSFGYSQQEILIAPNVLGKLVLRLWLSQSILKIGFDEAVEFQPDFYLLYGRGRLWQLIRKMSIFNKAYRDNYGKITSRFSNLGEVIRLRCSFPSRS